MEDPSAPRPVGPTMQPVSGVPLEVSDHSSLSLSPSLVPFSLFIFVLSYRHSNRVVKIGIEILKLLYSITAQRLVNSRPYLLLIVTGRHQLLALIVS